MPKKGQMPLFSWQVQTEHPEEHMDWDFKTANTQYFTHGLHPYPARMIPQIASQLMDLYLNKERNPVVTDVFCGSGTVNVEASLKGFMSIGIDINPFAVLLASTKVTNIRDVQKLNKEKDKIEKQTQQYKAGFPALVPEYKTIDHWFKKNAIDKLSYLKHIIRSKRNNQLRDLLWIAFANTLIKSSNVDWKSSRYLRVLPKDELKDRNPDVFRYFRHYLFELTNRVKQYSEKKRADAIIIRSDARCLPIADGSVDIIITSPPYGEERNTIPYIRWSKLFLLWLGIVDTEITLLEKQSLGGNSNHQTLKEEIPSKTFWKSVSEVPEERLKEALPFMKDYLISLNEMKRILKPYGRSCIVVGHRSISRHLIDMGKVTDEFGRHVGLEPESVFHRSIPKKMIPWTTPTGETILDESIVVLRKPK
jgi:DNA modification methylase